MELTAKVIQIISKQYRLDCEHQVVDGMVSGKMRLNKRIVVGDWVKVIRSFEQWVIVDVCERKNELTRPRIANVDQALVVISSVTPDFSSLYTDRLIFKIQLSHIKPVLIFTKMDQAENISELHRAIADYRESGYEVYEVDLNNDLSDLMQCLSGKTSVLCGNSGVGKSTLLNRLNPELNLKTQTVSLALNRGKHTTTYTTLHPVANGYIADTPGFSSLSFQQQDCLTLANTVSDFSGYLNCKFSNCLHESEPECGVKKAVAVGKISKIRYHNYLRVLKEIKEG